MAGTLSEQEIWQFLQEIEAGTITLVPATEPQAVYAGNVVYQASNGWEIWVFNDCNAWGSSTANRGPHTTAQSGA